MKIFLFRFLCEHDNALKMAASKCRRDARRHARLIVCTRVLSSARLRARVKRAAAVVWPLHTVVASARTHTSARAPVCDKQTVKQPAGCPSARFCLLNKKLQTLFASITFKRCFMKRNFDTMRLFLCKFLLFATALFGLTIALNFREHGDDSALKAATRGFRIDRDANRFELDGEPFHYVAGEIHYFRIPQEASRSIDLMKSKLADFLQYWDDRLYRMRAMGLNVAQIYVNIDLHIAKTILKSSANQKNRLF